MALVRASTIGTSTANDHSFALAAGCSKQRICALTVQIQSWWVDPQSPDCFRQLITKLSKEEWLIMRTRNNRISLYLDDKELERFNRKLKQTGLNRSTYLRQLIAGYGPTPMPDDRFWSYMNRISELADKIEEIAFRMGKPDEIIEILKETKAWRYLRCEIEKYYIVPKKIDTKQILKSGAKNDDKG